MEPRREGTDLIVELRAVRPTPRPEFAAELDSRVDAGFPPEGTAREGRLERIATRLRPARRRLPALAGAAAALAIAAATAVIAISEEPQDTITARRSPPAGNERPEGAIKPFARQLSERLPESRYFEGAAPLDTPRRLGDSNALRSGDPAASAGLERSVASDALGAPLRRLSSGPHAFDAARRDVERSARLVLATEPSEVRSAAARVFETVQAHDGIVLRSSIAAGDRAEASAVFDLLIPSGNLGDALAGFSEIAAVRSRSESTGDVTGRTTGLEERLRDSRARIASLLAELAITDTETGRNAVEAQLRSERGRLAAMRSALQGLERRVNLSRVSLRIEGGSPGVGDGGSWGVSDALDDAGRILAIAAGVTLIGLAFFVPVALLALLTYLARRIWIQRSRDQALG
jgi:Domain of unknown function (DUF4349)